MQSSSWKFIAINAYLNKKNLKLNLHPKKLEKEEQMKPKVRRKEVTKIRVEEFPSWLSGNKSD